MAGCSSNNDQDEVWSPEKQLQELKKRTDVLMSVAVLEAPSFKPNPDDVIVAVPTKNGTTWMLHICHQIRMQGREPDFESQVPGVIGWIEGEKFLGIDISTQKQPAHPRIFLTHLLYPLVPIGGRRIHCFRDQKDSIISSYYFGDMLMSLKGRVSLSTFAQFSLETIERRMNNLLAWWEHRHDDNVLLLFFDDLKEDHAGCVRRIAKFIGVDLDEDAIARVVHTTSHTEMSRHHSKFSSNKLAKFIAEKIGEIPPPEVSRVRKDGGKSGEGKQKLPGEVQQRIDQKWQEIVTAKLGFQDLKEMREAWKKELGN